MEKIGQLNIIMIKILRKLLTDSKTPVYDTQSFVHSSYFKLDFVPPTKAIELYRNGCHNKPMAQFDHTHSIIDGVKYWGLGTLSARNQQYNLSASISFGYQL